MGVLGTSLGRAKREICASRRPFLSDTLVEFNGGRFLLIDKHPVARLRLASETAMTNSFAEMLSQRISVASRSRPWNLYCSPLTRGVVMPEDRLRKPHALKYSYRIAPAAARNDCDIMALLPEGALSDRSPQ
jgi:hypothetical protein